MEKKYTVFVSSTYEDLVKERQEVMHALLEIDCIPCGMELFPASDDEQFEFIKDVIDDCDYYILILAGRYGSKNKEGISYTELEFRYAMERKIPIISFLHKNINEIPNGKCEKSSSSKKKLQEFRELAQKKLCKYWSITDELSGLVSRSMIQMIKRHPAIGWVRATQNYDENSLKKIIQLYEENIELRNNAIGLLSTSENLKLGEEIVDIIFNIFKYDHTTHESKKEAQFTISLTWNQLLKKIGPILISESNHSYLKRLFNEWGEEYYLEEIISNESKPFKEKYHIEIDDYSIANLFAHFMALGYVEVYNPMPDNEITSINEGYYILTPSGQNALFHVISN